MIKYIATMGGLGLASALLCNVASSQTTPSIAIESGNGQTVDQNRSLARPLQVRLTTISGNPDPNVGVTFTATRNNGLNDPEIVATTNAGLATWLPGPFRNPGTYTVTASAAGYNPISFSVTVNDTPYDYDGVYHCRTYGGYDYPKVEEIPSVGVHEFTILNEAIVPNPSYFYNFKGVYQPATHSISGFIGNGRYGFDFHKTTIAIDEEGTARVDGSFSIAYADAAFQPTFRNWRCIRK